MLAPSIILVEPQLGENIGAAARAMMNFGLADLRLVAPRDGWPNPKAYEMAVHAGPLLDQAKIFPSFREAIADLQIVYAATARSRDLVKRSATPREAVQECRSHAQQGVKTGLVFGRERTGLTNEEIAYAEAIVQIPADPAHASLNLGQSVVILAYEWFQCDDAPSIFHTTSRLASPVNLEKQPMRATMEEIESFFAQLESLLDQGHFFKTDQMKPKMWRALRSFFLRGTPTEQEIRTLRGMIRALSEIGAPSPKS